MSDVQWITVDAVFKVWVRSIDTFDEIDHFCMKQEEEWVATKTTVVT
jgi:hypothetical protein